MSDQPLERVLRPRSVAVVGASKDPTKRGHQVLKTLVETPFAGSVYAIHPDGGEVLGLNVFPSVLELPEAPDLVFIATPAATVPGILQRCGKKGVGGAVVPAVGFRESGEEGARIERELTQAIREARVRVVGPNTSGLINTAVGLNLVGIKNVPRGDLALLSQSGNVALDVINGTARWDSGISIYVGVGNETDIAFHEYLEYLEVDEGTRAVMMYVEGLSDGRSFIEVAKRVSLTKPVVLLKGGRSDRGVAAARSHTGAIAGSYPVLRAALRQGGVSEVERSDELLPVASALARQHPIQPGLDVVVLSDGGGHGTLTADALTDRSVPIARLKDETKSALRSLLGSAANVENPIDVAGAADRDPMVFARAIETIMKDPGAGGVMLVGLFGGYALRFSESLVASEIEAANAIADVHEHAKKPLVVHSLYAHQFPEPLRILTRRGFTVVESLEIGCRCLRALHARGLHLSQQPVPPSRPEPRRSQPLSIGSARRENRDVLMETEVRELLAAYDVRIADATLCRSADETEQAIRRANGPVALKVVSPSIPHKTDAGGVVLDVGDPEEGRAVFASMLNRVSAYAVNHGLVPDLRGVLVVPMLSSPVAELIVGVRHDRDFGPVLTVGAGGIAVEIHHDTALRGLPIGRKEALEMLDEIRISTLLNGYRGRPPAHREALADVILGVAACALAHNEIDEIEANPVFAFEDRAVVVDARAYLKRLVRSDGQIQASEITQKFG